MRVARFPLIIDASWQRLLPRYTIRTGINIYIYMDRNTADKERKTIRSFSEAGAPPGRIKSISRVRRNFYVLFLDTYGHGARYNTIAHYGVTSGELDAAISASVLSSVRPFH